MINGVASYSLPTYVRSVCVNLVRVWELVLIYGLYASFDNNTTRGLLSLCGLSAKLRRRKEEILGARHDQLRVTHRNWTISSSLWILEF